MQVGLRQHPSGMAFPTLFLVVSLWFETAFCLVYLNLLTLL